MKRLLLGGLLCSVALAAPSVPRTHFTAEPRSVLTVPVLLDNPQDTPHTVSISAGLPEGWNWLFPVKGVELAGQESTTELLSFRLPERLLAGTHSLQLWLDGQPFEVQIEVQPRREIRLQSLPHPERAMGPYLLEFWLENAGNVPEDLSLSARDDLGGKLELSESHILLQPFEGRKITVRVGFPASVEAGREQQVVLQATHPDGQVWRADAVTSLLLPELPISQKKHALKGTASFGVGVSGSGLTLQPEVNLQGQLSSSWSGDFRVQVSPQRWKLQYSTPFSQWTAGNLTVQTFSGNPLVMDAVQVQLPLDELWRFAGTVGTRGVDLNLQHPQWKVHGLLAPDLKVLEAAFQTVQGNERWNAAASLDLNSQSLWGQLQYSNAHLQMHLQGVQAGHLDARESELKTRLEWTFKPFQLEVNHLLNSPSDHTLNVKGSYRGQDFTVQAAVQGQWLAGEFQTAWSAEIRHEPHWFKIQHTPQLTLQGGTSYKNGPFRWQGALGLQQDVQHNTWKVQIKSDVVYQQPLWNASFSLSTSDWVAGNWTLGTSATWQQPDQSAYTLKGQLGLGSNPNWQVQVSARVPITLYTLPRANLGRLEGTLLDPQGQPLVGVQVQAGGLYTTTDAQGHFVFPELLSGPTQLEVQFPEALQGLRFEPALPYSVTLEPGQTRQLAFRAYQTHTLDLQVQVVPIPSGQQDTLEWPEVPDLRQVVVVLEGQEQHRKNLSADGSVQIRGLKKGTYRLQMLLPSSWEGKYTLQVPREIQVSGDVAVNVLLELQPRERQLQEGEELSF